jgi:[acyl-carrier-protein] S-malonyltransferase
MTEEENRIVTPETDIYVPSAKEVIAVLHNGQGGCFEGMGEDLQGFELGREMYALASDISNVPVEHLFLKGPKTSLTYLLATYVYGATLKAIRSQIEMEDKESGKNKMPIRFIDAELIAGHSAGELVALTEEAYTFTEGVDITTQRGTLLLKQEYEGTCMLIVKTKDKEGIENICRDTDTYIALDNAPEICAIGGEPDNIEAAKQAIRKAKKGKTRKIEMKNALHTPLYQKIGGLFGEFLKKFKFRKPKKEIVSNVTATKYEEAEDVKLGMERQVSETVQWTTTIKYLIAKATVFVEFGPGKAASYFLREQHPGAKVIGIHTAEDLYKTMADPYQARSSIGSGSGKRTA